MCWPFSKWFAKTEVKEEKPLPQYKIFERARIGPDGRVISSEYEIHRLEYNVFDWRFGSSEEDYAYYVFFEGNFRYFYEAEKRRDYLEYRYKTKVIVREV